MQILFTCKVTCGLHQFLAQSTSAGRGGDERGGDIQASAIKLVTQVGLLAIGEWKGELAKFTVVQDGHGVEISAGKAA